MRVLFLVPVRGWPDRITPYSFLDEEIRGLMAAGIEAFVISADVAADDRRDGLHMIAVPPGTLRDRLRTLPFVATTRSHLPAGSLRDARRTLYSARLERHAAEAVRRYRIDVMHTHFGAFGFAGMLARASTGTPLVATFRGMDLLMDPSINYGVRQVPFRDRAVRALLRKADMTTYVSEFMRETGVQMGASPATARAIRKGVDLETFRVAQDRPALRAELGVDGPMILTVAGLIPRKGVDTIITALAAMSSVPAATLVVCGDGYERERLVDMAAALGLGDRVQFRGWVGRDQIPRYFAACDLFVLGSRIEAAGNVVLEAMASGRPVVTTASGGPPEYVRDGVSGFVVEPGDAVAMADRFDRLVTDADLRESMGREGRRIAERDHPYGALIAAYLDVYRHVTADHGRA